MHRLLPLMIGLSLVVATAAQLVKRPTDFKTVTGHTAVRVRYKQVPPRICELDPNAKELFRICRRGQGPAHLFLVF